ARPVAAGSGPHAVEDVRTVAIELGQPGWLALSQGSNDEAGSVSADWRARTGDRLRVLAAEALELLVGGLPNLAAPASLTDVEDVRVLRDRLHPSHPLIHAFAEAKVAEVDDDRP